MAKLGFKRPVVAALHDLIMAALSFVLSLYLRLGDEQMHMVSGYLLEGTILFTVVCGLVFWRMRFYRALWRYASLPDLIALTKGVTLAILVFVPLLFLATRLMDYPRSAVVINWFVLLALLGGPRFLYRMIKDRGVGWVLARASGNTSDNRVPVLLVGAGDAAEMFIREMARGVVRAPYRVIGVLDDDRSIIGGQIHGVRGGRVGDRFTHRGAPCQMKNRFHAAASLLTDLHVADVAFQELHVAGGGVAVATGAGGAVVQHPHLPVPVHQLIHQMAADEPVSAGYQGLSHPASPQLCVAREPTATIIRSTLDQ